MRTEESHCFRYYKRLGPFAKLATTSQIYQAMKYLSLDIAEFIEQGPQMTGSPRV